MLNRLTKTFIVLALVVCASTSFADAVRSVYDPRSDVQRQIQILDQIAPYVMHIDQARLTTLRETSQSALDAVNQYGLGHKNSLQGLQRMILVFRYSDSFFTLINGTFVAPKVTEIRSIEANVSTRLGFDHADGATHVEIVLRQMHKLILQTESQDLPSDIKDKFSGLKLDLGKAIAIATQGDRPNAFAAADDIYYKFQSMYPRLNQLGESNMAFSTVMELMELNEFYANYAQIRTRSPQERL